MFSEIIIGLLVGVGLASAVGFRIFVPLLMVSIVAYLDWMPFELSDHWSWLGSSTAVIAFGVATIVEIFGYYIPWVDNVLDTITGPIAAIVGTMMVAIQLDTLDSEFLKWAMAIIAGGGTATVVSGATSGSRMISTSTTTGIANPIISTAEIGTAGVLGLTSLLSLSYPVLIFLLLFFLVIIGFIIYKVYQGFDRIREKVFKRI
ncbi:MAG: DUF4126 domain-containing protein [Flavobacteriales bacterium]